MVVVSHLFFFLRKYFRGRCDSLESHRPLSGTIYFPIAPFFKEFMTIFILSYFVVAIKISLLQKTKIAE